MRFKMLFLGLWLALGASAAAQQGNMVLRQFNGVPSGSCATIQFAIDLTTGDFYDCFLGAWLKVNGGGGGSGTVTHTAGALILNQLVFGNGAADIAVGDLTGDVTTSGGKATTLATVATPGTGLKTTVNAKGLVTAVATAACADLSNGAASCSTDTTNAANISSGTLPAGRMPALTGDTTSTVNTVATTIANGVVTRAKEAADGRGWAFCGTASTATTTVGPVSASTCCSGGLCKQFMVMYQIIGYNGGTPIGRLLVANGTISTTARTNANSESEGVTAPSTQLGATAIPGLPLAVTASNIGRSGTCFIDGASGSLKTYNCTGTDGTPAIATAPTLFRAASFFSDLGTNLALANFQLTVYDGLTQTAASAQTFTAGTYLAVWGRNTD
jgi:hypothetical protein